MPFPLGPILAQSISIAVGDRTEGRAIFGDDSHYEASTRPNATLGLSWRRSFLALSYGPSLTVTPLESPQRQYVIFHGAVLSYTHAWKLTSVGVGEAVGYGNVNFRTVALSDSNGTNVPANASGSAGAVPANTTLPVGTVIDPSTGSPVRPGSTRPGAVPTVDLVDNVVKYASSTTSISVTHRVSAAVNVFGSASYTVSGSVGREKSALYPLVKGPTFSVGGSDRLSGTDAVSSTATLQYVAASNGAAPLVLALNGAWVHRLNTQTVTLAGVGATVTRTPDPSGLTAWSIYPTANAGIAYSARLARGLFFAGSNVAFAPALDLVTAAVDPRITLGANAGWSRAKFSAGAGVSTGISTANAHSSGAFSSFGGSVGMAYRLAPALSADTGFRAAYQLYQGAATVPFTYAFYVGLTFGAPLYTSHP